MHKSPTQLMNRAFSEVAEISSLSLGTTEARNQKTEDKKLKAELIPVRSHTLRFGYPREIFKIS